MMTLRAVGLFVLLLVLPLLFAVSQRLTNELYERTCVSAPPKRRSYWMGNYNGTRYALWLEYRRLGLPSAPLRLAVLLHVATIGDLLLIVWLLARSV
jgi:hypothetical protein